MDLWGRKRPLYQLRNNHCPREYNLANVLSSRLAFTREHVLGVNRLPSSFFFHLYLLSDVQEAISRSKHSRAAAMRGRLWQTWKNNRAFNVKDLKFYFKPRARFFNGPHPASFCLFSSFTHHIYCTNTINDRSVDGVLGT